MNARRTLTALLAGLVLAVAACRPKPATPPESEPKVIEEEAGSDWFEDITASSGVKWSYRNGEDTADNLSILESLGGGIALIDFDGDGLYDIFVPGGGYYTGADKKTITGSPCKLFRNLGKGKFEDVTAKVGLDKLADGAPWFYTHGAAVADYDRDGWPDLLVTGWGRIALFRNIPVDPKDATKGRRFVDVSAAAGLDKGITWATSAAWADLDGDGYPDLYVCQYVDWSWQNNPPCHYDGKTPDVCPPKKFAGLPHKLFRNTGKGRFEDVSKDAGLLPGGKDASKGLGVIAVDVNGDGKPDLYVANDTVDKFLYINQSIPGRIRLREAGRESGAAVDERGGANGSMGLAAGDYDRSGRPSLWVTNYENELHGLYKNGSKGDLIFFGYRTQMSGIAAIGQSFVGWGTGMVDFDLDGWEDIFVSNGHAVRFPRGREASRKQRPVLLRNQRGRFTDISRQVGPYGREGHLGRGVGLGDLDNDGRVDLVLSQLNDPVAVLRNVAGAGNHWLGVRLVGKGHACTVGAKITLEVGGATLSKFQVGGGSYASSGDPRHVFGLGKETTCGKLTVTWPNGGKEEFSDLAPDRYHTIVQGKAKS